MNSAIYSGTIRHRRFGPVQREFAYEVDMFYLDLDEIDDGDLVVPAAMMGAPTVMVEKIPNGKEILSAFEDLGNYLGRSITAVMSIEAGGMIWLISARSKIGTSATSYKRCQASRRLRVLVGSFGSTRSKSTRTRWPLIGSLCRRSDTPFSAATMTLGDGSSNKRRRSSWCGAGAIYRISRIWSRSPLGQMGEAHPSFCTNWPASTWDRSCAGG